MGNMCKVDNRDIKMPGWNTTNEYQTLEKRNITKLQIYLCISKSNLGVLPPLRID